MKLNSLGRFAMNNAARASAQRRIIAPLWLRLGGPIVDGRVLEIGCGRGVGTDVVRDTLGAAFVCGLDLDPKMLTAARRRPTTAALLLGDAAELPVRDHALDAVVDFGAIHLIPDWPSALIEVRRALKPGGNYYFEWVTLRAFRAGYRLIAQRFETMRAPRADDVLRVLDEVGLPVEDRLVRRRVVASTQLVGDLIGVGRAA